MDQTPMEETPSELSEMTEAGPSTTTITTVAVQAGRSKIVLAILKSNEWIRVRIQQMEPDLMEVGGTLQEAQQLLSEHQQLLTKLNMKQKDVTELLSKADNLAAENQNYQEVYTAMAASLAEAWRDLNVQLEYRTKLLNQSIAFHQSADMFSDKMEAAAHGFSHTGSVAYDIDTARRLIQQHQDIRKNILDASRITLQEGQALLDRIREMGMHADVQNKHATTAACYGIEHLLELLHDRRRHLEDLWLTRKIKLEQCLQLLLLDQEVKKVLDWYDTVGEKYLSKRDLGDSLRAAQYLQQEHMQFESKAREVQDEVLRLLRTADQLIHSAHYDAEGVQERLAVVGEKCEDFMIRLDARRKNLAMTIAFYKEAQTALTKLNEIEQQLESTDLPKNSAALAERHAFLSSSIYEATTPALRDGHILLERVGREDSGAQGVVKMMTVLQEHSSMMEKLCRSRYEAGERSQAYNLFQEKFRSVQSWLVQIGQATLSINKDMGTSLSSARDFLEIHERLDEDIQDKESDLKELTRMAAALDASGDQEAATAQESVSKLREQWELLKSIIEIRVKLALSYVGFHKKAQQLAIQMDSIEQYLKIEKMDATLISEEAVHHKEQKWLELNRTFTDFESQGKKFIHDATDTSIDHSLDTKRAVTVVQALMAQFSERRTIVSEYYEQWRTHVTSGKDFKTMWQQFIQDCRKTIDWIMKEETEFFPRVAGELGSSLDEVLKHRKKLEEFQPTVERAQEEVDGHLATAEELAMRGDTKGEKDKIVNELLKTHGRFSARLSEYRTLLTMTTKFFKNLSQLDELIKKTEREYQEKEMPREVMQAELMLREHVAQRNHVQNLMEDTAGEGEQIVIRVRQQDSESVVTDEVQRMLSLADQRRSTWDHSWQHQCQRLEHNLQICQFYFDLRQLHNELDELTRQLLARQGQYGSSLPSANMTSEAFQQFELTVPIIGEKIDTFVSTAHILMQEQPREAPRIEREVNDLQNKWGIFQTNVGDYRKNMDVAIKYFAQNDRIEEWLREAGNNLLQVGREAADLSTSQDAITLIQKLEDYRLRGQTEQDARLRELQQLAVILYGNVTGPHKVQMVASRNGDILNSYTTAVEELIVLRDNLVKKEQILRDMEKMAEKPKVPIFVQGLQGGEVSEGQKFTFVCKVACETVPKIEWFKDNLPVNTPDYETQYEDGVCRLTIDETFSEDTAKYTCRATSDAGAAETSAYLRVRETHQKIVPPEFTKHLKSIDIPEGSQHMLECHVTGLPSPQISWFKDDQNVDNSPDYVITKINGTCCVKVRNARLDHGARYTCRASNPGGEVSSTAQLNVIRVQKPVFTQTLKNMETVQEGKSVKLECRFKGEPEPQIQWLRGEQLQQTITQSAVFKIITMPGYSALIINEAYPEDTGMYTAVARNMAGETRCHGHLNVESIFSDEATRSDTEPVAPQFIQKLHNKEVPEGGRCRLDCVVIGSPEPEVIWYHNGKPVKESKDFQLLFEGDRCSLLIREVYLEDGGEYKCVARNPKGTAECSCRVTVEPMSELSDGSGPGIGEVVAPKFTQLLKDTATVEGQRVEFTCRVIGNPQPVIKWYRDHQLIHPSAYYEIISDKEVHKLVVREVFPDDAGSYMVKATNQAGEAKCYATLQVQRSGGPAPMAQVSETTKIFQKTVTRPELKVQAPEFRSVFIDKRVTAGQAVKFQVVATGTPKPKIKWLFNNEPVVSPDYQISNVGNTYTLYIPEVFDEDSGRFTVIAENEGGKATCTAVLQVVEEMVLPKKAPPAGPPPAKFPKQEVLKPVVASPAAAPVRTPEPHKVWKPVSPALPRKTPTPVKKQVPSPVPYQAPAPVTQQTTTEMTRQVAVPSPQPMVVSDSESGRRSVSEMSSRIEERVVTETIETRRTETQSPYQQGWQMPAPQPQYPVDVTIELPLPPKFLEPIRSIAAEEGTRCTFSGIVEGNPEPVIRWYKEGHDITTKADYEISYKNHRVTLIIPEVFKEDTGQYTCEARNAGGEARSTAELVVRASGTPPKFIQRLQSQEVQEGENVRLSVRVTGKPAPEVTWYREGIKLISSPDFEIKQQGELHSLLIPEVYYEDSGKFSVKAINPSGEAICTAELHVEARPLHPESATPTPPVSRSPSLGARSPFRPTEVVPAPRPAPMPQFSRPLQNIVAKERERVVLECTIAPGLTPEVIQWYHDDYDIKNSPDYHISDDNGVCTLIIEEVFPEDAGRFTCTITVNKVTNSTYMYLTVQPVPQEVGVPPRPPVQRAHKTTTTTTTTTMYEQQQAPQPPFQPVMFRPTTPKKKKVPTATLR